MRMMMTVQVADTESGNDTIEDGSLAQTVQDTVERVQPEAAYFYTIDGCRAFLMVFEMQDTSEIPAIAEPLFMNLNARVHFQPVMNGEELERGLQDWASSQD